MRLWTCLSTRQTRRLRSLSLMLLTLCLPLATWAADERRVADLTHAYGCLSCHGMVHKQIGPGFAQVAARYRNDATAAAQLAARIRGGGVGNWGRVIMPRQPKMTEAEARLLAEWVLSQPSPP